MAYEVRTGLFEGPLDLLLQLIRSHQLEITELSLTEVVNEYVGFIEAMRELDLEVTSDFLLIASTLVQLKARHLLPDARELDMDEDLALTEGRDRLLSRLLACLTFKDVAVVMQHRFRSAERNLPRTVGLEGVAVKPPNAPLGVTPARLSEIAETAMMTTKNSIDMDHLDLDLPSVSDAITELRVRIRSAAETEFGQLVEHCRRPMEVIAYFLALLELARWGVVQLSQVDGLAPIGVVHVAEDAERLREFASEWSHQ